MKEEKYKRKPGDYEIRVLTDGRIVMIAPNQELMELAQILESENKEIPKKTERKKHGRNKRHTKPKQSK